MLDTNVDQNFWDDVDSIRELIDEDNQSPRQNSAPYPYHSNPQGKGIYPGGEPGSDPYGTAQLKPHQPLNYPSAKKNAEKIRKSKQPKMENPKGLKTALAFFYLLLFIECTAISWLGAIWYSWMF